MLPKKIIIVGNWNYSVYENAFAEALKIIGYTVIPYQLNKYFKGFIGNIQNAIPIPGPALFTINRSINRLVNQAKPDLMLAWRCTHLLPSTIKKIKKNGAITVSYNNDDPFGPKNHVAVPWHHHFLWYWYLKGLKLFDYNLFYRQVNVEEAKSIGVKNAEVLKPYFIPWYNRPVSLNENEKKLYGCDVAFIGHYEPDNRVNHLYALVKSGLSVKLYGGEYWTPKVLGDLYYYFSPIIPAEGENYAKAIRGAKVCLAFLSKINRDTYTRRCFEIPACGRVMLAERTDDLLRMFVEDKEACFFSSTEEMVNKAKWLVENPGITEKIAAEGLKRVWADKHDVNNRALEFISLVTKAS